jgi:phosphoglycerate dehydrogenase-like enzyme
MFAQSTRASSARSLSCAPHAQNALIAADVDRSRSSERANADGASRSSHQPVRTEDELAAIVGDAEILVTRAYNKVTRRVLDARRGSS